MRDPDNFDAFYSESRERLLAQTFALTGDLEASRKAVRDAFVVAWHHWRKLSLHDDPESVVRPHAWRLAQRRHTARIWHRDKDLGPDVKATLDALGKLSGVQRRAVILTQLAAVSMPQMAREVGVTTEVAERELQHAATSLSLQLDVQTPALRMLFDDLAGSVTDTVRWPRATIVRRAGATRRRTHTTLGVGAVVATLVVSGSLLTTANGVRPSLERPDRPAAATRSTAPGDETAAVEVPTAPILPVTTLLGASEVRARFDLDWSIATTGANDEGTGLVLPCQLERYADPRGQAALVRTLETQKSKQAESQQAFQLTEASGSALRAKRTYATLTSWFGDCRESEVQLLATGTPKGVGDQAVQVVLRATGKPQHTYVVGIARTGIFTTATVVSGGVGERVGPPAYRAGARLLSAAVDKLCSLPDAGACGSPDPQVVPRAPLEAGTTPAMLSEIDLPRIADISEAWVGTEPRIPLSNDAASSCDSTSFRGKFDNQPFTNNATRTFVIPETELPTEFGLTQTMGSLPGDRAAALVAQVRQALASCDALNTTVTQTARIDTKLTSITTWRLEVEVTDARTVTFLMAILRDGTSVSQLGFFPDTPGDMSDATFLDLARRALERLAELPGPRKS